MISRRRGSSDAATADQQKSHCLTTAGQQRAPANHGGTRRGQSVALPGFPPRLAVFTPCNAVVNQLPLQVSRRKARCRRGLRCGPKSNNGKTLRRRCAQMRGALRACPTQIHADDFESRFLHEPARRGPTSGSDCLPRSFFIPTSPVRRRVNASLHPSASPASAGVSARICVEVVFRGSVVVHRDACTRMGNSRSIDKDDQARLRRTYRRTSRAAAATRRE
jgi:hypothetical protein